MMNHYKITKYTRFSRYVILFFTLIFFVVLIKRLLNVSEQDKYIDEVKNQTQHELEKDSYNKNYYMKYLQSDYANYFKSHEKGITVDGEQIVKFQIIKVSKETKDGGESNLTGQNTSITDITDPKDSWNHFIKLHYDYFLNQF